MSSGRMLAVARLELASLRRRPNLWILIVLLAFTAYGLSSGNMTIGSGDASVGGAKAWITSEFATAFMLSMVIFLFYSFFLAIAAGLAVTRDDEAKVGPLLHATPLTAGEYVWGKLLGVLAGFLGVLALHLVLTVLCNHVLPNAKAAEIRGPFMVTSYLVPVIAFGLPALVFIAGTTFAVGERTRRPVLVFVLPLAFVMFCALFLWSWSPTWLDPRWNRVLMLIDPAGVRWLSETWLKVDRGVAFYNQGRIGFDAGFILSRLAFVAIGLGSVGWSHHRFAATLRGGFESSRQVKARRSSEVEAVEPSSPGRTLAALDMRSAPVGMLRGALEVARVELRELLVHPGLYLFVPIIIVQAASRFLQVGMLDAPILITPGFAAASMTNTLTLLVCMLLLFYTVESMQRDSGSGLGAIAWASPTSSAALLAGKALANSVVGALVLLVALATSVIVILIQGRVPLSLTPFAVVWGLVLLPTYLMWSAFVAALYSATRNRYATYGLALAAVILTGWFQVKGTMSWVGNWNLWDAVRWSDMGPFQADRAALVLNRVFVLSLAVLFIAIAVRLFPRRSLDPVRIFQRLAPGPLLGLLGRLTPVLIVPLVVGTALLLLVDRGWQGGVAKKWGKDYWKQNLATWKDAPLAAIRAAVVDVTLDPPAGTLRVRGTFTLANPHTVPLDRFALTTGRHWKNLTWTLDGKPYEPDKRTALYVITPPHPLAAGEAVTVGFSFDGRLPDGVSKNGAGQEEFILPSGVVLTSFRPTMVPVVGFDEEIGVDEDNELEPRVYPDDFWKGLNEPLFGASWPFTTRITVTVPEAYTANSVGVLESDTVKDGRRTVVWRSDQPVRFFNIVAGKWAVRRGHDTAIYYHGTHTYNLDEMAAALDGMRLAGSEWFYPYPWKELKVSEFPAMAYYAQGFPTDITFSEGIGFLTKSDPESNAAFAVTAHEAAHQWWGNILTPGKGPGGNVVSEGLAQYTTAMLFERLKGSLEAAEFRKRIEERYGDRRFKDAERPLVKVDGSRRGDTAVMYEKGAWAFFMLTELMGRERALAGLSDTIRRFKDGPDYPVLQDVLAVLREHAADPERFDAFTKQWFYDVVVPEYKLPDVARTRSGNGWTVTATVRNDGTGVMPVELAAARGDRRDKEGKPAADYHDTRVTVTVPPGESRAVSIACPFEPDRVVVDPDVKVLQLNRNKALRRF
jgi:ABC-2 type transport system permease protein